MKPVIYVVAAVALVGISLRVAFMRGPGALSVHRDDSRQVLSCNADNARKALIVYQPVGNGRTNAVADKMGETVRGKGYDVEMNVPGDFLPKDLSAYSLVAFGSPVYAGQVSTVLTDYMKSVKGLPKDRVVIFSVGGVVDEGPELSALKQALNGVEPGLAIKFNVGKEDSNASKYAKVATLASN